MPSSDGIVDVLLELIDSLTQLSRTSPATIQNTELEVIRSSWQFLLGIDSNSFIWDRYENFQLQISTRFTQEDYYFLQFTDERHENEHTYTSSEIPNNLFYSMGHVSISNSLIQEIDDYSTQQNETVSRQLSLLNKIRNVLLEHQMIATRLSDANNLLNTLRDCYEYEIHHQRRIGLLLEDTPSSPIDSDQIKADRSFRHPLELQCTDETFTELYKQCLNALLSMVNDSDDDDTIKKKIDKSTRLTLNTYMKINHLDICYDLKGLSNFHMDIIKVIKSAFKNNKYSEKLESILDRHYSLNPILPILRPVLKLLNLPSPTTEQHQQQETEPIPVITNDKDMQSQVRDLLTDLTRLVNQYKELLEHLPPSIIWFPSAFKNYLEILDESQDDQEDEGDQITESDLAYIEEVMKLIKSLPEQNLLSHKFYDRFEFLCSILTIEKHEYKGFEFPTVHMRGALVRNKHHYRIFNDYFQNWHGKYEQMKIDLLYLNSWDKRIKQRYLHLWFNKIDDLNALVETAGTVYRENAIIRSLSLWADSYNQVSEMEVTADLFNTSKWVNLWVSKLNDSDRLEVKALKLEKKLALSKVMSIWKLSMKAKDSDLVKIDRKIILKVYLKAWKSKIEKILLIEKKFNNSKDKSILKYFFKEWKQESTDFVKLKELKKLERRFILSKSIGSWVSNYNLIALERQAKSNNNKYLKTWVMERWKRTLSLETLTQDFVTNSDKSLIKRIFLRWLVNQNSIEIADTKYNETVVKFAFNQMKLKMKEVQCIENSNYLLADRFFKKWRLKLLFNAYVEESNVILKNEFFDNWKLKFKQRKEIQERLNGFVNKLILKPYLNSWVKRTKNVEDMERKALNYEAELVANKDKALVKDMLSIWISKLVTNLDKENHLEQIYDDSVRPIQVAKYFDIWKSEFERNNELSTRSARYRELALATKAINKWITSYDRILELEETYETNKDLKDSELLSRVMSTISLKIMKIEADKKNAITFQLRWDRNKLRTFYEIWKFKLQSRSLKSSPDRTNSTIKIDHPMLSEVKLSPTSARRRRLNQILRQKGELLPIPDLLLYPSPSTVENPTATATGTSGSTTLVSPNTMLKTPAVSSFEENNFAGTSTIISASERVRKINLENRMSRYSQYKQSSNNRTSPNKPQQHSESSESPEKEEMNTPTRRGRTTSSRLGQRSLATISRRSFLPRLSSPVDETIDEDNIFRDDT